jgi:hypothetical protein
MSLEAIHKELELYESLEAKDLTLEKRNINKVKHILADFETRQLLKRILSDEYITKVNYGDIVELNDKIALIKEVVQEAKEEIDLDEFYKRGEIIDFRKLKAYFKANDLQKRFPNFKLDKYEELIKNPPLQLTNFKGEVIHYDKFIVRKILIGINQMIFNEMDLYLANSGSEGSGKSCWSSQLIFYLYHILKEVGLITYDYDVKKLFFSSLKSMIEVMDEQEDNDYFRIMALDEAYELNRSNFRDENSKLFKDDMRSSRKMQRIIMLNLPQLGELELPIIQTRLNFIFDVKMDNQVDTGMLKKGNIDFYIMPRGKTIYSTVHRRDIGKAEIVNSISAIMKDKNDSYKGLPKNCLIHQFKFAGVWGFNKEIYDKHIKKENKKRRTEGENFKLSKYGQYLLYRYMPDLANWDKIDKSNKADKKAYYNLQKIRKMIRIPFLENRELCDNMQRRLEDD